MIIQTINAVMMNFSMIFSSTFFHNTKKNTHGSGTYLIRGNPSLYFGTLEIILPGIRDGNQCLLVLRGAQSSIQSIRRVGRPFFLIFSSSSYSWPTIYLICFALIFLTARIRYSHSGSTGFLLSMKTGLPLFLNILMCSQPGQVSVIIRISVILWFYFPRKQLHNDPVKRNISRASFTISTQRYDIHPHVFCI